MTTQTANIRVIKGDLFESDAQCLVNTVNTVGVMGKGIALGFKKKFPDMFADYVRRCAADQVKLGEPYLYRTLLAPWVINFPTKGHWRALSRLSDIDAGLTYLEQHIEEWGVESLAVPPLGCGEGGLEWRVVGPRLYEHLSRLPIPVTLYAPFTTPHEELQIEYLEGQLAAVGDSDEPSAPASRIPPAAIALLEVLRRVSDNPFHGPIGRVFFQKLAYFTTERIPTGLVFEPREFGPFAANLKKVTSPLINNGLFDEEQTATKLIKVSVGDAFPKAREAYARELSEWSADIDALVNLLARMDSRQAEVAATVHYAAKQLWQENNREPVPEMIVLNAVKQWKANRRPPLSDTELASAIRNLGLLGWLHVEPSRELPVDDVDDVDIDSDVPV